MNNLLPINQFVCHFCSRHLCLPKYAGWENSWTNQYQKRYVLADDIQQATEYFKQLFENPVYWPKGFHEVVSMGVSACNDLPRVYLGSYNRFDVDIRTEKAKQENAARLNLIKNKIELFLQQNV